MCYHLRLKLPEHISKPRLGSHTNLQNYSGEKKRESKAEQTTFSHYFKVLCITAEFCSSQLFLELSPSLTELVRKEKIPSLKTTKPPNLNKWRAGRVRKKQRTCEKKSGLTNTTLVPPTPLPSAKFHRFTSQAVTLLRWIQPPHKKVTCASPKHRECFCNRSTNTPFSYPHDRQIYVVNSELMHTGSAQIRTRQKW